MTPSLKTDVVQLEVAAPRQSAQEAIEMQRAIGRGEVDAFVVGASEEHKRVLMLSEAHVRYRQLVEDMQQGAVTVSGSGEILFANHSFAAMLGVPLIDLFRASLESHVSPPDRARLAKLLSPRAGEPDMEIALARRNGGTVAARVSVVSASDDFVTLLITDLNPLLLERQRHQEADARTRAFLGTLAEEFGDILKPMRKSIEDLKRKPSADAEERHALEQLERQGARLLGLVEDLGKINPKE